MAEPPQEITSPDRELKQTNACLICGQAWSSERPADYSVLVLGGNGGKPSVFNVWLCHLECLRDVAHTRYADRFAIPSLSAEEES